MFVICPILSPVWLVHLHFQLDNLSVTRPKNNGKHTMTYDYLSPPENDPIELSVFSPIIVLLLGVSENRLNP